MAVGAQFSSLISDLRAELRRSTSVSVGVDDLDSIKRVINSFYRTLLADYEWPHLHKVFDKIPLAAGQYKYNCPTGFDPDNVEETAIWFGGANTKIKKGIDLDDNSFLDPDDDQRSDPVLAWDTRFDVATGLTQFIVWPIPASDDYSIQFSGTYNPPKLVNDNDVCLLDDELLLGFAAARLLKSQDSPDANLRAVQAEAYLQKKKVKPKTDSRPVLMGLGTFDDRGAHPSIVIRPSS